MNVISTKLNGVYIIEPKVFGDDRGWFIESYSKIKTPQFNCDFVQDNHSFTMEKGTLRGIHFQKEPYAQAKLVRCVSGSVLDVAVDLRKSSPTFKEWIIVELSSDNKKQLFIPRGFGHGFLTLTDNVNFLYKADNYYNYENDRSIIWSDPQINIDWGITNPMLSKKDEMAPTLKDSDVEFI